MVFFLNFYILIILYNLNCTLFFIKCFTINSGWVFALRIVFGMSRFIIAFCIEKFSFTVCSNATQTRNSMDPLELGKISDFLRFCRTSAHSNSITRLVVFLSRSITYDRLLRLRLKCRPSRVKRWEMRDKAIYLAVRPPRKPNTETEKHKRVTCVRFASMCLHRFNDTPIIFT